MLVCKFLLNTCRSWLFRARKARGLTMFVLSQLGPYVIMKMELSEGPDFILTDAVTCKFLLNTCSNWLCGIKLSMWTLWSIYMHFLVTCIYWESSTAWRGEISLSCTLLKLQFDVSQLHFGFVQHVILSSENVSFLFSRLISWYAL